MKLKFTLNIKPLKSLVLKHEALLVLLPLAVISVLYWVIYYKNGLGLAYNDARSHLDIARRVVEGLKPGLAQIGSVWLPLPHILMATTVWNDFFWHSGLSGAIISMISFIATGVLVYKFLHELNSSFLAKIFGVVLFAANVNVLYLQSTAMTELLLLSTMTAGAYYLMLWAKKDTLLDLLKSAFFIMLSTLVRYDGWFLILTATLIIAILTFRRKNYREMEGTAILFMSLGGLGIALWFLWNALIFKDPLYFAFGPFSAHAQQEQLLAAGDLPTKGNVLLSTKVYLLALLYNSYTFPAILGLIGSIVLWFKKNVSKSVKFASLALLAPLIFNILALYLGHSVLFIQGISGNTWFNVRYGIMLSPSIAIFAGVLIDKARDLRWVIIGLSMFVLFFAFANGDAVTIDDARVGSSQKNVTEVSGWLHDHVPGKDGFILVSAASHDAIIFSSGLPMSRFIHEGTGAYWESAVAAPDRWARWIVVRTHDENDLTFRLIGVEGLTKYNLVDSYPFADVYELKDEYLGTLNTKPVFSGQK